MIIRLGHIAVDICTDTRRGFAWRLESDSDLQQAPFTGPPLTQQQALDEALAAVDELARKVREAVEVVRRAGVEAARRG